MYAPDKMSTQIFNGQGVPIRQGVYINSADGYLYFCSPSSNSGTWLATNEIGSNFVLSNSDRDPEDLGRRVLSPFHLEELTQDEIEKQKTRAHQKFGFLVKYSQRLAKCTSSFEGPVSKPYDPTGKDVARMVDEG